MKNIQQIEQVLPDVAQDPEVKEAAELLDRAQSLASLKNSPGFEALKTILTDNAISAIARLRSLSKDLNASRDALMAAAIDYDTQVSTLSLIVSADNDVPEMQAELDKLIIEKQSESE